MTDQSTASRPLILDDFANLPRWVAWREELRKTKSDEQKTKVPYDPHTDRQARIPTDPSTWGTRAQAEERWRKLKDSRPGGVGIVLGRNADGTLMMGLDLDECIDENNQICQWACDILDGFNTYAEVSPSGQGIKAFFVVAADETEAVSRLLADKTRKPFIAGPHQELAIDRARFYAVTGKWLRDWPETLTTVSVDIVHWFLEVAGPHYLALHGVSRAAQGQSRGRDESGSGHGFRLMSVQKRAGKNFEEACAAILNDEGPAGEWANRVDERQLRRAWDNAPASTSGELEMVCVADVPMKEVDWVWEPRLARGKVTIMSGDPGLGKSQIAIDVASRITIGGRWPDNDDRAPRGKVVVLAAEDAVDDTIRPRLEACRANVDQVHVIKMVKDSDGKKRAFNLGEDLEKLAQAVERLGNVVMVDIDPISAYVGDADSHKITVMAPIFGMLAEFAERSNVAVLAIHHPPKGATKKAIHAFSGSLAFVAGPRVGLVVVEDSERERKLLLAVKSNIGKLPEGLGFNVIGAKVDDGRIPTSRIEWDHEPVTVTANEALHAANSGGPHKLEAAIEFLGEQLADGPVPVRGLLEAARERNIGERTLREAKDKLGVKTNKVGFVTGWSWELLGA